MAIQSVDTAQAEREYMIANTPLFFLKKLRANPGIRELSRRFSAQEILAALPRLTASKPTSLSEAVLPYVLLVALSQNGRVMDLRAASDIAAPHHDWYKVISKVLAETSNTDTINKLYVSSQTMLRPQLSGSSTSKTQIQKIPISGSVQS